MREISALGRCTVLGLARRRLTASRRSVGFIGRLRTGRLSLYEPAHATLLPTHQHGARSPGRDDPAMPAAGRVVETTRASYRAADDGTRAAANRRPRTAADPFAGPDAAQNEPDPAATGRPPSRRPVDRSHARHAPRVARAVDRPHHHDTIVITIIVTSQQRRGSDHSSCDHDGQQRSVEGPADRGVHQFGPPARCGDRGVSV
jgi:hypothetical protein